MKSLTQLTQSTAPLHSNRLIYGLQAACASIAVPLKTEKYYDLCGSLGFISATAFSLYWPALRGKYVLGQSTAMPAITSFHPRQLIMSGLTMLWAGRLGTFLFQRIQKHGGDSRFDDIKQSPPKFFGAWMMQATWITVTALPVWLVNTTPRNLQPKLGPLDFVGLGLWALCWGLEVVADREKSQWREAKKAGKHNEEFIKHGTWSISRHPNYFGEVGSWVGQYILAYNALSNASKPLGAVASSAPWFPPSIVFLALSSPLLEYALIRYISGVPMLEKSIDDKLKDDKDWKRYKETTPVFFPFIGGTKA